MKHVDKKNFLNRNNDGLPRKKVDVQIIVTSPSAGDEVFRCRWIPAKYQKDNFCEGRVGYLGTAVLMAGLFAGIGFHAWDNSDSEFIYYRIIY